jgi:hypothetical protein
MPSLDSQLLCIEPGQLTAAAWPCVRDMIRRAIERTGLGDFGLIERDVLSGRQLLWMAWNGETIEAAATTELGCLNDVKICFIRTCSGTNRKHWLHHIEQIEAYARAEGCAKMRITGRKGWEHELHGFRSKFAVMDKEL